MRTFFAARREELSWWPVILVTAALMFFATVGTIGIAGGFMASAPVIALWLYLLLAPRR